MKIKTVKIDNRKKRVTVTCKKGEFHLPYAKLNIPPTAENRISHYFIDPEIAYQGISYTLENGEEDVILMDQFLDYNKDPDYLKSLYLFRLSCAAQDALKKSKLSKNEVCRRLKTSPSQLARLLDQTNHKKSVDKMLELLAVLGVHVELKFDVA